MDIHTGHGESMKPRETAVHLETVELKARAEIEETIGSLGHNLLSERSMLEKMTHQSGTWLEHVQSEVIDSRGAAIALKEGGAFIGFVLVDHEGNIKQFRSVEGRDVEVLRHVMEELKDKGVEQLTVELTDKSERARSAFLAVDFTEEGRTEERKIRLRRA